MNTRNKKFIYFSRSFENNDDKEKWNLEQQQQDFNESGDKINNSNNLLKHFFPDILKALGNRAIKENTPSLQELEQYLQNHIQELMTAERRRRKRMGLSEDDATTNNNLNPFAANENNKKNTKMGLKDNPSDPSKDGKNSNTLSSGGGGGSTSQQGNFRLNFNFNNTPSIGDLPIVSQLIERGYLVDSKNWLKKKGFLRVGQEILSEIIKSLKADKLGMHETHFTGSGNIIQENSKKYEFGNELSNININSTIMNFIERQIKNKQGTTGVPIGYHL